jgi:uncharacterized membrane protein
VKFVAALAYVLPPVSGLVAYFAASTVRVRWHGLQAVLLGLLWPAALYAGAAVTPGATQAVAALGTLVWLLFLVGSAVGRDPRWPVAGEWLRHLASSSPRER